MAKGGYVPSKAAYYEGLQYANKDVKPVDFGALALGISGAVKDKYEREEKKRKEDEAFQMKIDENFGDVIYPSFDKTGLENIDIYQSGVVEMVSARSQDLNDQYNTGSINKVQYNREMTKLKGQAQQFRSNFNMITKFANDYKEMGDNIDPASEDTMQMLQDLFSDAKPYLTADNRLGNMSAARNKKGEIIPKAFLWDKAASMLQVDAKYDTFGIPKQILGIQGELSKFIGSEAVLNTHLDKQGNLKEGTSNLIAESIDALSDRQVISYARQLGITPDYDDNDITSITNRDQLEREIIKDQKEKTLALLQQKQSLDEVEKTKLDIALQDSYLRQKKMSNDERAKKGYNYSYYTKDSAQAEGIGLTGDVEEFTVTKDIQVKNIPIQEIGLIGNLSADAIETGQVKQLHRNANGEYMVTISYSEKTPILSEVTGEPIGEFTTTPQTRRVRLTNRPQKNYFLSIIDPGLGVISDPIPKPGEQPTEKPKAY